MHINPTLYELKLDKHQAGNIACGVTDIIMVILGALFLLFTLDYMILWTTLAFFGAMLCALMGLQGRLHAFHAGCKVPILLYVIEVNSFTFFSIGLVTFLLTGEVVD